MNTYIFLQHYWWFIVSLLGAILVFLLFVQGGNSLIFCLGKTEEQRKMIINSTGRKWEFTFTTLVTFGGAFFASFPLFYSTSFGGAYWLWMIILFTFVLQAVSYEFQSKAGNLLGKTTYRAFLVINGVVGPVLLGGAVGKSAQLPLQTWLADAMAGPTPVSALIHAATMVTAGVYLIARTHGLFLMTPEVLHLVGIVGAVTLLLAGFAALVQTDIKRVLAYSTMSQIGYMFLALGVQAWDAAIFHLMTHAFFKALLFLASGSVILACHHEQNIFKMGGLRKSIPLVYLCFLVGGAALSALPLVTAGFFSKDEILAGAMANGHINLMVAGLVGAFMTSLYTFRMIFIVFHGKEQIHAHAVKGVTHSLPLIVLLILSTFVGALIVPPLQGVLPQTTELAHGSMLTLEITSGVVAVVGILLAAWLWLGKRTLVTSIANSSPGRLLGTWWYNAWGFDWLYDKVFVKPFLGIAWLLKRDPLNSMMNIPAVLSRFAGKGLLLSENGYLRWYVASMSIGAVVVLALLMVLR